LARILLLLIIGFLIYLLLRGFFRSQVKKDAEPPTASGPAGEDMVACARCGVNVPRSETRVEDGRPVCASNPNCR
jgi:uncharacterized protein